MTNSTLKIISEEALTLLANHQKKEKSVILNSILLGDKTLTKQLNQFITFLVKNCEEIKMVF